MGEHERWRGGRGPVTRTYNNKNGTTRKARGVRIKDGEGGGGMEREERMG